MKPKIQSCIKEISNVHVLTFISILDVQINMNDYLIQSLKNVNKTLVKQGVI